MEAELPNVLLRYPKIVEVRISARAVPVAGIRASFSSVARRACARLT